MTEAPTSANRNSYWPAIVVVLLIAVPFLLYGFARWNAELAGKIAFGVSDPPGPMPNAEDWPKRIQELNRELTSEESMGFEGYLLHGQPGEHSVKEAVFRVYADKPMLERFAEELHIVPLDRDDTRAFGYEEMIVSKSSPDWWVNGDSSEVVYYMSQEMLDGEEGDLYVAAYDKLGAKLFVFYWFNF